MKPRILVTRTLVDTMIDELRGHFEVDDSQQRDGPHAADKICRRLADCDGVLLFADRIDAATLDAAPHLKAVCNITVSYNNVDVDAYTRKWRSKREPFGGKVGTSLKVYASDPEGIEEGREDVQERGPIRQSKARGDGGEPVENQSERGAAKRFGISRKTVSKMVRHAVPPGYQRKEAPVSPKLGPFIGVIHQILQDDREVLKKQRHTAVRIYERLRDEHGYGGGYTVIREFVGKERLRQKEVFVPLVHPVW